MHRSTFLRLTCCLVLVFLVYCGEAKGRSGSRFRGSRSSYRGGGVGSSGSSGSSGRSSLAAWEIILIVVGVIAFILIVICCCKSGKSKSSSDDGANECTANNDDAPFCHLEPALPPVVPSAPNINDGPRVATTNNPECHEMGFAQISDGNVANVSNPINNGGSSQSNPSAPSIDPPAYDEIEFYPKPDGDNSNKNSNPTSAAQSSLPYPISPAFPTSNY